jgi:hypothetical protein
MFDLGFTYSLNEDSVYKVCSIEGEHYRRSIKALTCYKVDFVVIPYPPVPHLNYLKLGTHLQIYPILFKLFLSC